MIAALDHTPSPLARAVLDIAAQVEARMGPGISYELRIAAGLHCRRMGALSGRVAGASPARS